MKDLIQELQIKLEIRLKEFENCSSIKAYLEEQM